MLTRHAIKYRFPHDYDPIISQIHKAYGNEVGHSQTYCGGRQIQFPPCDIHEGLLMSCFVIHGGLNTSHVHPSLSPQP